MDWRIYYDDGATFDSTQGPPQAAPGRGVISIVYPDPDHGRAVLWNFGWYYWHARAGEWWGSDIYGLLDQLMNDRTGSIQAVKQGSNASNEDFRRIHDAATNDPDFPVKTGARASEHP